MNRAPIFPFLAAIVALACVASAQTGAKIAVANPAKIFGEIQETKDLKSKLEGDRKTLEATELDKRQKIKDLQAQRDTLRPDSTQYADLNKQLVQASIDFEVWGKLQAAEIQRQQKQQIRTLYEKIAATVGEIAQQRGIDVVIAQQLPEFPDNMDQIDVNQLRGLISQRDVLYAGASVDISNEVIASMDAKYKSGK